ncbi:MAG: IS4 family transposase [Verrucomicrobia bacterium]|nr:IS4 family transposase [Verrucomicrobiota bacterium]
MNSGRYVLTQLLDLVHWQTLARLVARFDAESRVRHFGCRQQLICMAFAQLTWREGLRDIATCLNARPEALYHLGFREPVAKSTLADANEQRDWRLWEDLARGLMRKARILYAGEDLGLELENTVYALDSTTIDLSLTLFPWADFRRTQAGIKMHTQIDLRGPIPTCIYITGARQHDVLWLDELIFEPGAFYVMDRGYMDFSRLNRIASAGAFFVTRAKDNLRFSRQRSLPVDYPAGVRSDQIGKPTRANARAAFPSLLRKVRYFDADTGRDFVFLTNHLQIPALTVAKIYRLRWRIELFFRWIKGHLRIKHYYGTSPNAVKTQVWIAVASYLMVAILHKQLALPGTLHRTLQLLSVHPFEKMPLHELLAEPNFNSLASQDCNQMMLFDL